MNDLASRLLLSCAGFGSSTVQRVVLSLDRRLCTGRESPVGIVTQMTIDTRWLDDRPSHCCAILWTGLAFDPTRRVSTRWPVHPQSSIADRHSVDWLQCDAHLYASQPLHGPVG